MAKLFGAIAGRSRDRPLNTMSVSQHEGGPHVAAILRILPALFVIFAASARADYVLPTPDGGGPEPSPPSLSGRLTRVSLGTLTVRPDAGEPVMVLLASETQCWTLYGGTALVKTLPLGQKVEVWFTAETVDRGLSPPVAAVVRVERRE